MVSLAIAGFSPFCSLEGNDQNARTTITVNGKAQSRASLTSSHLTNEHDVTALVVRFHVLRLLASLRLENDWAIRWNCKNRKRSKLARISQLVDCESANRRDKFISKNFTSINLFRLKISSEFC